MTQDAGRRGDKMVADIRARWLAMDIQRSGTPAAELWMMVQDLLAVIRSRDAAVAERDAEIARLREKVTRTSEMALEVLEQARREEQAKVEELRGLLWQAIRMYDGGGFAGDNVDRWFTGFIFHKDALGDDPYGPPASAPEGGKG